MFILVVTGTVALITILIAKRVGAKKGVSEMDDLSYYFDDFDNYNDTEIDCQKNGQKPDETP
jgi:hypothetical protein